MDNNETNTIDELITSYRKNLEFKKSDEDLIKAINDAIAESQEFKLSIDKIGEKNKKFWENGTSIDFANYSPKKSRVVVNRIFTDVETAIPTITANMPVPTVVGNFTNEDRDRIQRGLEIAYEIKYQMQQKLQCLIRHWFLFKLGVWKYRWSEDKGYITENVLPKKIGLDKRATCKDNCEYIWEELEETAEKLIDKFPSKKDDILQIVNKDSLKSKIRYYEFWGGNGEWVCWVIPSKDIILDKKKNPNYDYEDPSNNIFSKPQFPYIFLNVFNIGDETSLFDNTSLIEECIPIQEGVNKLEQQIIDLNEGQKRVWITSGEAMSEKKAQDLVNKTGDLLVFLDRKAPTNALAQVQSGKPDASLYNNLTHLLSEIDNVMGVHSTTRGERAQQETATGRQLLLNADIGRMDMIVRNVEQAMEEWYNSLLHCIKVYNVGPVVFQSAEESISISPEEIPPEVMIMVKKGSTLPTDDLTKMQMAQGLAQMSMIDPTTLFQEMGYSDVDQRVQNLYEWLQMTGRIVPQQPAAAPAGEAAGAAQSEQLARLQEILQNPQIKQLSPEEQANIVEKGRQIVQQVQKGGAK